jgi:hypothetical protein
LLKILNGGGFLRYELSVTKLKALSDCNHTTENKRCCIIAITSKYLIQQQRFKKNVR